MEYFCGEMKPPMQMTSKFNSIRRTFKNYLVRNLKRFINIDKKGSRLRESQMDLGKFIKKNGQMTIHDQNFGAASLLHGSEMVFPILPFVLIWYKPNLFDLHFNQEEMRGNCLLNFTSRILDYFIFVQN